MRCFSQKEVDSRPSSEGEGEGHRRGSSTGEENGGSTGESTGGTTYWEYVSPWFEQRLIDDLTERLAPFEEHGETSWSVEFAVQHEVIGFRIYRQKAEFPVAALIMLDLVWLVWLLVPGTAANSTKSELSPTPTMV